jgi:riboflavin synthase
MFTGIIEHTGTVSRITRKSGGVCMEITTGSEALPLKRGGSIAINGVCLTVTEFRDSSFSVDVVQDTLARTNLAHLRRGRRVNIEMPLRVGDRLDGHILEGHVDGMGTILSMAKKGIQTILRVRLPSHLVKYVVENGSIGIDGVSLTVKGIERNIVTVTLVPYTVNNTTFARRPKGEKVNIEVDRAGKYLERQLKNRGR